MDRQNKQEDIEIKRFRLLIIGKSGCGKTTILSKVCGENMSDRPSTSRGFHNIDKEIVFASNDKLVAHDSEGFEAGQQKEVDVVKNFIKKRSKAHDVNDRLHMIWYCIEMNSRPIQQAEKEFFAVEWEVPVIAIVTKFDTFIQDIQQSLEEAAEERGDDMDDDELEQLASKEANIRFKEHYVNSLSALPNPPKGVIPLSDTHKSTPTDSRLANLIKETMLVLTAERDRFSKQLGVLFASAQKADVRLKLELSTNIGMAANYIALPSTINRETMIEFWNTNWSKSKDNRKFGILIRLLEYLVDDHPETIGHKRSSDRSEFSRWNSNLQRCCHCEQAVADTTLIMEHIYLLKIEDESQVAKLLSWYRESSRTSPYARAAIMAAHRLQSTNGIGMRIEHLSDIICGRPVEAPRI